MFFVARGTRGSAGSPGSPAGKPSMAPEDSPPMVRDQVLAIGVVAFGAVESRKIGDDNHVDMLLYVILFVYMILYRDIHIYICCTMSIYVYNIRCIYIYIFQY